MDGTFEERRAVAVSGDPEQEKAASSAQINGNASSRLDERRQHTRFGVDAWAEVLVKDGSLLFRGRVLDVSLGGCYMETKARLRLAPGTPVEMVFRPGERAIRCEATTRMIRSTGAGFVFEAMDARTLRMLQELIGELGGVSCLPARADEEIHRWLGRRLESGNVVCRRRALCAEGWKD